MPRKPANKVSKGRPSTPTANNIRNMNQDVTRNYDKNTLKAYDKLAQKLESKARNTKPVGPNARNAVASRGRMGGPVAGTLLAAATPGVRKLGTALGTKLGVALRPVGRAIDRTFGPKPKKKPKK